MSNRMRTVKSSNRTGKISRKVAREAVKKVTEKYKKQVYIVEEYDSSPEGYSHPIAICSTLDKAKKLCEKIGALKIKDYIEDTKFYLWEITIKKHRDKRDRDLYRWELLNKMNELISAWRAKYIWDDNDYIMKDKEFGFCKDAFYIKKFIIDEKPKYGKFGEYLE